MNPLPFIVLVVFAMFMLSCEIDHLRERVAKIDELLSLPVSVTNQEK